MKLDFDIDSVRNNKIELLDCQVDLILRSLEFYCHTCVIFLLQNILKIKYYNILEEWRGHLSLKNIIINIAQNQSYVYITFIQNSKQTPQYN